MSVEKRHRCIVCGRPFPHGQGVIVKIGNEELKFHSNRCFAKFAKNLLERIPADEIRGYIKKLKEEYEDLISQRARLSIKKL